MLLARRGRLCLRRNQSPAILSVEYRDTKVSWIVVDKEHEQELFQQLIRGSEAFKAGEARNPSLKATTNDHQPATSNALHWLRLCVRASVFTFTPQDTPIVAQKAD